MAKFIFRKGYNSTVARIEDHIFAATGSIELIEKFNIEHDQTLKFIEQNPKTPATHPHLDKHGIIDRYNIEGYGWVTKDEGIALTQQGKVDAIVAISPHGHPFLRGRPHHAIS